MPVSVKVGGAWKTATAVFNKVGGVWKTASDMPVKIGGVWKTGILESGAYESIATVTAAGGESSLSFTSIPSTYKHLQIRGIARTQANAVLSLSRVQFNSDTGTNYTQHTLYGNGSTVAVDTNTSDNAIQWLAPVPGNNATANVFGAMILDIHDYASTTKYKTVRVFAGDDGNAANTDYRVFLKSGLWMSTSAITSINLFCSGITWAAGTTFALYGIKGA